jgi:hypothetical protein
VAVRACTLALLLLADAVFLWMFLSSDPLEQLAGDARGAREPLAAAALAFAADWRHGMAGNAWIYMPGFFVTAAAVWLHARHAPPDLAQPERVGSGTVALILAVAAASAGSHAVVRSFVDATGISFPTAVPQPSVRAAVSGVYTLLTWSVFVLACRRALVSRTVRPFVAPAILAVGLVVIRPWTVDDFAGFWFGGITTGSPAAVVSLALVFALAALLAASERRLGPVVDGSLAQPEPREPALHGGDASRGKHDEQICGDRDEVEARRLQPIEDTEPEHHQDAEVGRRRKAAG